ncbi:protein-tyrosine phosphatase [Streptomyces sp. PvR006]|uniref:tyrosine-protein phosphatase n=1 Tax=unclassified Streptomyces TaxID=2593676 RepID=UPI001AE4443D|nr:tyrosine-protein phosphatase [Streptomyces sp. PvR006]MBP2583083.1 protein-tyrosine phosphatase [Streptomyces sp. PvR006]
MTASSPGRAIPIVGVPNLRDLGGWRTPGGRVVRGQVFRSAEFSKLQDDDATSFAALGIRSVYDLRTEDERAAQANVVPDGVEYVVVDVLADHAGAGPAQLLQILRDPRGAEEMLGGGKAVAIFEASYREFLTLPSAMAGFRRFFTALARQEHRPALFHCTTGKDRTGWAAASLLMLLGVDDDDVLADYLLTNEELLPSLQPTIDGFASIGGDPDLLQPVLGVREEYLAAARDEMTTRYGSADGYFSDGLRLDTATIDLLRTSLVESA